MDPIIIAALGIVAILVLVALGMQIGIVLFTVAFFGLIAVRGLDAALQTMALVPYTSAANYSFAIFPMFILMGEFMSASGILEQFFAAARAWMGRLPGGLGVAVVAACTAMAACTGSSLASTALMSRVAIPEMKKYGYDVVSCAGLIAAVGPLAVLIPPSIYMVFYSMFTGENVGKLLLAGFIPGFMSAALYTLLILFRAWRRPDLWPRGPSSTWKEKLSSLKGMIAVFVVIFLIIGGLYGGIFTPSEVGAIGAFIALLMLLASKVKRPSTLWSSISKSVWSTACIVGGIYLVILGALMLTRFLVLSGASQAMAGWISTIGSPAWVKLAGFVLIYLVLGCFLDAYGMLAITLPITYPLVIALGYDGIVYGIIVIIMVEAGAITPPFGITVYTVKTVLGSEVEVMDIFRNSQWFLIPMLAMVAIVMAFPQIVLWLPSIVMK